MNHKEMRASRAVDVQGDFSNRRAKMIEMLSENLPLHGAGLEWILDWTDVSGGRSK